jgi:tetratricopeptide (TPR) repeat protein
MGSVIVEIQTGTGMMINQTVTNNEGDFSIAGLSLTSYIVIASAPGYKKASEHVEFVRTVGPEDPGELRTVEIILSPIDEERTPPPSNRFAQDVPKNARDAFDRGMKLSRDGKSQEAVASLREATSLFPQYFDAHLALGNELIRIARHEEAIGELEQARRINAKDDRVYQSFGLVLMEQKKYAVAAAVLAEASRLNPTNPQPLLMRATALIDHASVIDPKSSGKAADERDQALRSAEKDLKRADELSGKKLAAVHLQMARLHEKRGERAEAARELERYLELTPGAPNADAIREAIKKLRAGP